MATAAKGSAKKETVYNRQAEDPKPSTSADADPNDDTPDDPLFDGFASAEIGSMPELMALLQDDEILDSFQNETTTKYLRQISMDPSVIDSLLEKPEIKFLADKIRAQYEKTAREKGTTPGTSGTK